MSSGPNGFIALMVVLLIGAVALPFALVIFGVMCFAGLFTAPPKVPGTFAKPLRGPLTKNKGLGYPQIPQVIDEDDVSICPTCDVIRDNIDGNCPKCKNRLISIDQWEDDWS